MKTLEIFYTQQELEEMVDADLNKIAGILSGAVRADCNYAYYKTFCPKYCGNWGAAGSLVDECNIDIQHDQVSNGFHFASDFEDITSKHKNIKRAITIVYILINQILIKQAK